MAKRSSIVWLFCLVLLGACSQPRSYVVLLESPDGTAGAVTVTGQQGESRTLNQVGYATGLDGTTQEAFKPDDKQLATVFGAAMGARPEAPITVTLYFKSDRTELTAGSANEIPGILDAIARRTAPDISIIGHSDRYGDEAYNHRLALRRARAIQQAIVEAGVDASAMDVTSHGENNPLVPTADNVREPKNRRVEVTVR